MSISPYNGGRNACFCDLAISNGFKACDVLVPDSFTPRNSEEFMSKNMLPFSRKDNPPKQLPTQTKRDCTNSLRKLFLSVSVYLKEEGEQCAQWGSASNRHIKFLPREAVQNVHPPPPPHQSAFWPNRGGIRFFPE